MIVQMLQDYQGWITPGHFFKRGDVVDFPDDIAELLVGHGRARYLPQVPGWKPVRKYQVVASDPASLEPETPQPEVVEPEPEDAEVIPDPAIETVPDDLTLVKGIGPATAEALQDIGITTYQQLVDADPAEIDAQLDGVLRYISADKVRDWQEAAKELI